MACCSDWRTHQVPTFNGMYDTNNGTGENYQTLALGELWKLTPTARPKARAPAIIPSLYSGPDARTNSVQKDRGQYVALTGDIDSGNHALGHIVMLSRDVLGSDTALFIYSTGSATAANRRWRILAPLQGPITFSAWNETQEAFYSYMAKHGVVMDRALARAAQPVFLPNVPQDKRNEQGKPIYYEAYRDGAGGLAL